MQKKLQQLISKNELVIVFGTGTSIALTDSSHTSLSWKGLIQDGLSKLEAAGQISETQFSRWGETLKSEDIDDLLATAEFVSQKFARGPSGFYERWLEQNFKLLKASNKKMVKAIQGLHQQQIPFATTNYDHLLESITNQETITFQNIPKASDWMRRETNGILHLHGSWDSADSCILGIRHYEKTLNDSARDLFQRGLATFRTILFIGCGDTFSDPNFRALVNWLRSTIKNAAPQHYALVKDNEVAKRKSDPNWIGLIEPLSYGNTHDKLPEYLTKLIASHQASSITRKAMSAKTNNRIKKFNDEVLVDKYCKHLIKDSGQMAIEGLRTDLDLGRQRFDIENLFVPLEVIKCLAKPKNTSEIDSEFTPRKRNPPIPFGHAFKQSKRLALLALPGAGKTLLLKRLAVAYADPSRQTLIPDNLPKIKLVPILIRCREWRGHIEKPIPSLLQSIPEITGQPDLHGIQNALTPILKKGSALLLVDGLDEIHDDAKRTIFAENLERFLSDYPKIYVVVTSREAGFDLIAPKISRACERWRIAPLSSEAITNLCLHWGKLMNGDSRSIQDEARKLSSHLLENSALRRLAENPLLLTMLLVVKQGAGKLPPDRVSLYNRAIEVLLDTWNISGHAPLNTKEALPQLAFIAFELMRQGKQTATEGELLELLYKARTKIEKIKYYANDLPYNFLKRVELRSSVLIEAGLQVQQGKVEPFYQFRHLTFQEYLAALAIADGYYLSYKAKNSVITPIQSELTSGKWKEVIPMAAVLARKQGELVLQAIIKEIPPKPSLNFYFRPPSAVSSLVSRLFQCLIEETEVSSKILNKSLRLIVKHLDFNHIRTFHNDIRILSQGPYGLQFSEQAWLEYVETKRLYEGATEKFIILFSSSAKDDEYNISSIKKMLESTEIRTIAKGLSMVSSTSGYPTRNTPMRSIKYSNDIQKLIENHISLSNTHITPLALRALNSYAQKHPSQLNISINTLNNLLSTWLSGPKGDIFWLTSTTLSYILSASFRPDWSPKLTANQALKFRRIYQKIYKSKDSNFLTSHVLLAYYLKTIIPLAEVIKQLHKIFKSNDVFSLTQTVYTKMVSTHPNLRQK